MHHHHYMIDRLAKQHLAELHAEATIARLIRERRRRRPFRLRWRRTHGAAPPLVVIDNPDPVSSGDRPETSRVA